MLKYYFDVEYTDGSTFTQNKEDKSATDEKRSAFYDVCCDVEKGKKIKLFLLSDGQVCYAVNLLDGSFIVNGAEFRMHEMEDLKDFKIIFYRQHTHDFLAAQEKVTEQTKHAIVYRMGWQATNSKGQNIQCVMQLPEYLVE